MWWFTLGSRDEDQSSIDAVNFMRALPINTDDSVTGTMITSLQTVASFYLVMPLGTLFIQF